jgi:hypothetical protein
MISFARKNTVVAFGIGLLGLSASAVGCAADTGASLDDEATSEATSALTAAETRALVLTKTTDSIALSRFSLQRVLQQIIDRMPGVTALTPAQLYAQMFDNFNKTDHAQTTGAHCASTLNGFATECPRMEGILAATNPFVVPPVGTPDDRYLPTAIVNRFDLAPTSGVDCGEYRIVFAKATSSAVDRNFLIFEGRLPNPSPALGLHGCTPVVQLWQSLSTTTNATTRANLVENLYFTGLTSGGVTFEPVVDATHYGMTAAFAAGGAARGQIRANLFLPLGRTYFAGGSQPPGSEFWQLRELQTRKICDANAVCSLQIRTTTARNNPDGSLFAANPPVGSKAETFQTTDFIAMVPKLAQPGVGVVDASLIGMNTPNTYNSGESSSDGRQNYVGLAATNTVFKAAITSKLAAIGRSDLTANNILARASTQSCGGCHQPSIITSSVGGGMTFPASNQFTQIDETGKLSTALTTVFLPHRKAVMDAFLAAPAAAIADAVAADSQAIGGDAVN